MSHSSPPVLLYSLPPLYPPSPFLRLRSSLQQRFFTSFDLDSLAVNAEIEVQTWLTIVMHLQILVITEVRADKSLLRCIFTGIY